MDISWFNKKLEARRSPISGTGVFTKNKILRNEVVAVFGGFVVDTHDLEKIKIRSKKTYGTILDIGYQISDHLIYAPIEESQFSVVEYLNHSCNPNCGFKDSITLIAIKDIPKNTELSMDYAMCISLKILEMKCSCGSSVCRKYISADDWKNSVLQKKYNKFFQPYIKEKIKSLSVKK